MEIKGKVHLFFEQSATFRDEFKKLGYEAFDYDIQNNFGETDYQIDLFAEIEKAYDGKGSVFDNITKDDLIMSFFPCIHFCDAKTLFFKGSHNSQRNWSVEQIMKFNIEESEVRQKFFVLLMKLFSVVDRMGLRLILENPWNTSQSSYLQTNFINPTIIDKNRMLRGDYFVKPTAYWFVNIEPTYGLSIQKDKKQKIIMKCHNGTKKGICSEERSMISPDYARNFIKDFILGEPQSFSQLTLF